MTDNSGRQGARIESDFHWGDPLRLEYVLTDEERMIRDGTKEYCQKELQPRVLMAHRDECFDREIMTELGAFGLLGATIPEEYGGAGAKTWITNSPIVDHG